jgi:hypothetical protein
VGRGGKRLEGGNVISQSGPTGTPYTVIESYYTMFVNGYSDSWLPCSILVNTRVRWPSRLRSVSADGGLGSSHTVPFGTAVPARPPTRSWEATPGWRPALCSAATRPLEALVRLPLKFRVKPAGLGLNTKTGRVRGYALLPWLSYGGLQEAQDPCKNPKTR